MCAAAHDAKKDVANLKQYCSVSRIFLYMALSFPVVGVRRLANIVHIPRKQARIDREIDK